MIHSLLVSEVFGYAIQILLAASVVLSEAVGPSPAAHANQKRRDLNPVPLTPRGTHLAMIYDGGSNSRFQRHSNGTEWVHYPGGPWGTRPTRKHLALVSDGQGNQPKHKPDLECTLFNTLNFTLVQIVIFERRGENRGKNERTNKNTLPR